jgi:hypothetical protein
MKQAAKEQTTFRKIQDHVGGISSGSMALRRRIKNTLLCV